MSKSNRPLNVAPCCRKHNLWIVAVCVSDFCDLYGVDQANEYFAAGQAKLAEFLVDGRLTKPIPYVRKCIKNAILENWQTDRQLAIPRTTRRDMDKRGDTPPDRISHCWDDVFDSNGLRSNANEHQAWDAISDGPDDSEWGPLDNIPNCESIEDRFFAPASIAKQWSKIIETLEVVYSNCRDDLDRQIVEARLDGFTSIDSDPLHEDDVARKLGITSYEVHEALNRIERRYYK